MFFDLAIAKKRFGTTMQFPVGLEDSPFKHMNKRAGWNKCAGRIFSQINKHASTSIWYTKEHRLIQESGKTIF